MCSRPTRLRLALCAVLLLLTACTSSDSIAAVTAVPTTAPSPTTTPSPTTAPPPTARPADAAATAVPVGQDTGVPFPPPKNIVDWSPLFLDSPQGLLESALEHPLADGLLTESEVGELFGGEWRMTWGEVIEYDEIRPDACDSGAVATPVDSAGIYVSYSSAQGSGVQITLRRGDDVGLVLEAGRAEFSCDLGDVVTIPSAGGVVPDVDAELVYTTRYPVASGNSDPGDPDDLYSTIIAVTKGDLLVAASASAPDKATGATNRGSIAEAIAIMIERLAET